MSRVDKTEDNVQKLFREYQDQWFRYAEGLDKGEGTVKVHTYVCVYKRVCVGGDGGVA